jgi:hypothetical protein
MLKTYNIAPGFSPNLRVWNYVASRFLTDDEVAIIKKNGEVFATSWQVHGAPLKASVEVYDNALISIMVDNDQAGASGCSIDKSVKFIQALEAQMDIQFMDRMKFIYSNSDTIQIGDCRNLQALDKTNETLIFNHLSDNRQDFEKGWSNLENSWVARLF